MSRNQANQAIQYSTAQQYLIGAKDMVVDPPEVLHRLKAVHRLDAALVGLARVPALLLRALAVVPKAVPVLPNREISTYVSWKLVIPYVIMEHGIHNSSSEFFSVYYAVVQRAVLLLYRFCPIAR